MRIVANGLAGCSALPNCNLARATQVSRTAQLASDKRRGPVCCWLAKLDDGQDCRALSRRVLAVQCPGWLSDFQSYRAVDADLAISVSHLRHRDGRIRWLAESCRQGCEACLFRVAPVVAQPIAGKLHDVLVALRCGLLSISAVLALHSSSRAIEAARVGLNRAHNLVESRHRWLLRLESIAYVVVAAIALLALGVLVVLGPLIWAGVLNVAPGIVLTLICCIAFGEVFGAYLSEFARNYASTYAGLASVMAALVFVYSITANFVYGGELNAAIMRTRNMLP